MSAIIKNIWSWQRIKRVADYLFSLFDTKPEYIEASINKILEDYGSVREYAKNGVVTGGHSHQAVGGHFSGVINIPFYDCE